MKFDFDVKKTVAVIFTAFISVCGILTLFLSPRQIFGGLVRGYINTPEESSVFQKLGNSVKTFDGRVSEYFVLHDLSIHSYGGIQRVLNKSLINDVDKSYEVVKLKNGYLTFRQNDDVDVSALKNYIIDFKKVCDSAGSKLLFVNNLSKDTTNEKLIPDFYPYVYTSNFKQAKSDLKNNGVTVLDLEDVVNEQNIDKFSLFFKTDHHWTPKTGLWVSRNIVKEINSSFGWKLDTKLLEEQNYVTDSYPSSFLGTQGRRVGVLYAGADDFDIVRPRFDTDFTVEIAENNSKVRGDFCKTMIYEECITPDNLLNRDETAYDAYMGGNHSLVRITNHSIKNGKKALFILNSYGCVVYPYLAVEFQHIDCIDIRGYTDSVEDFIRKNSPDVVIYAIGGHQ